ncbi:hypothetical protein BC938DRAFT_483432, partial [Jimgerdemannia flammicorona]
ISDFGLSKTFTSISRGSQLGLTLYYVSPERISSPGKLTHQELIKSDIYAYGLVALEVVEDGIQQLYGLLSYQGVIIAKFIEVDRPQNVDHFPGDTPPIFREIINQCLKHPSDRPPLHLVQDSFKAHVNNPLIRRTIPETLPLAPMKGDKSRNTDSTKGGGEKEDDGGGRQYVRYA